MPKRAPLVFVADDQLDVTESLRLLLKGEGIQTRSFTDPQALVDAVRTQSADAILLDLNYTRDTTSGEEGLDAIANIRAMDADTPVVAMTAWGSIGLAVEAMRRGAQDFIEKPWDNERLLSIIRTQLALGEALKRAHALAAENRDLTAINGEFIADSAVMQPVLETIERVAPSDANVLITGESGCGKGLIARMIHDRSERSSNAFVVVNIGSLAETVFESEMFGHVKGAFTDARSDRTGRFELSDGGTLFLDEIANIPVSQQARLLRVLEDGEFEKLGSSRTEKTDVRVLSATNADVKAEMEAGKFREDLLYRLNTIHIHLPPLRERGDDIVNLTRHFLERHSRTHRRDVARVSEAALSALRRYSWPGNVRELSHVIERAILMARGDTIEPVDLRLDASSAGQGQPRTLDEVEREAIEQALSRNDGNVVGAAAE
ncbi:MAG: sigma-54-dependent transcriptional regulator [Gammaproteobacteria bacterium]